MAYWDCTYWPLNSSQLYMNAVNRSLEVPDIRKVCTQAQYVPVRRSMAVAHRSQDILSGASHLRRDDKYTSLVSCLYALLMVLCIRRRARTSPVDFVNTHERVRYWIGPHPRLLIGCIKVSEWWRANSYDTSEICRRHKLMSSRYVVGFSQRRPHSQTSTFEISSKFEVELRWPRFSVENTSVTKGAEP